MPDAHSILGQTVSHYRIVDKLGGGGMGSDGSESRQLLTVSGCAFAPRFSPDGTRIRFTQGGVQLNSNSLWEAKADGAGLHSVLAGWLDQSADGNGPPRKSAPSTCSP